MAPDNELEWLYVIGLLAIWIIRLPYALLVRKRKILVDCASIADSLLLGLSFGASHILPCCSLFSSLVDFADYHLPVPVRLGGVGMLALSLRLFQRAHSDLGLNWSISLQIGQAHSLVTHGVYRHIRHPMYASLWLWALAQAMLLQNWIAGFAMSAAMIPLVLYRVPREERMMRNYFGEDYRSYEGKTNRFIPRVLFKGVGRH
jgi:protein-S-isoprenylcysteine O-methyltransferase Ste14